jgi:hypothetical protein
LFVAVIAGRQRRRRDVRGRRRVVAEQRVVARRRAAERQVAARRVLPLPTRRGVEAARAAAAHNVAADDAGQRAAIARLDVPS